MAEWNDVQGMQRKDSERDEIKEFMNKPLAVGDVWYLLDVRWFNRWKSYVGWNQWDTGHIGDPNSHPGQIDNSSLLEEDGSLKKNLSEELEYVLIPDAGWEKLVSLYGLTPGQEPISRKVINRGALSHYLAIEIYLFELKLAKYPDVDKVISKKFSKADTLEVIESTIREAFNIPQDRPIRLLSRSLTQPCEELNVKKQTIQETNLTEQQTVIAEVQNEDRSWPRQNSVHPKRLAAGTSNFPSRYNDSGESSSLRLVQPGLCGLNNLGNTCFMNSVLQCMSNTPPIVRYFLEDRYWSELNEHNPLGNKGEIAKAFAELLKNMWSGQHHSFPPRTFKHQVGKFAPQFSGYQQHDSQELLTFLLDGLHEDLNRIKDKPYVEAKDNDGRIDEEVANEAWTNYRKRNDSVIVDLFHGLLKSTLVCPECDKVSVTFDPACYLSLPLPVKKERQIELALVPLDPLRKTVRYRVTVSKLGTVGDLAEGLSKLCGIPTDQLAIADVHQCRFHQILSPEYSLNHISDKDSIYAYELQNKIGTAGICFMGIYLKERKTRNNFGYGNMFGIPFIIQVPREGLHYDQFYEIILNRMIRYVRASNDPRSLDDQLSDEKDCDAEDMDTDEGVSESPSEDNGNEQEEILSNGTDVDENSPRSKPRYLFSMEMVNCNGNSMLSKLSPSSKTLIFGAKCFISCEFDTPVKEACYDVNAAEDYEEDTSYQQRLTVKKQVLELKECLELFTTTERLGADDAWYCPKCKEHQRATKKFDLWSLPEVLVIHLKRFSYTRSLRDKIDVLVEFPTKDLDMTPYIINPKQQQPAIYDLIGVCNHFGGLGGGHYTAYAKNKDNNRWYCFDDSSVSEAQEDSVCSKAAYVLFYIRRNGNSNWIQNIRPSLKSSSPAPVHKPIVQSNVSNDSEEDMDSS